MKLENMELQIYIPFSTKINAYLSELKRSLFDTFTLEVSIPQDLEILRVPIKSKTKTKAVKIVKEHLYNKEFKIRFATKYNTDQISLTNTKIEISVDERSWNAIVDFQKQLLDEIEEFIDSSNPIIIKGDTHHSERPKEYLKKYGTDNVLNWHGASIQLAEEKNHNKRKEIYKFISDSHPLDVRLKGRAIMQIL